MSYTKTNWQNGVTPINETNLNKIENQLEKLSASTVVTTADTNLNDYIEDGIYYFSIEYTPINIPLGVNGWLEVKTSGSNNIIKQLWYRHGTINSNDFETFVREKTASGWSQWQEFAMINKKGGISLLYDNEITIGTTVTLSEALSNFRFVVFRISSGRNYITCPLTNWNGFRGVNAFSRFNSQGMFELLCVRGSISENTITIDDAGRLTIASDGTMAQEAYTVSEVWGIR